MDTSSASSSRFAVVAALLLLLPALSSAGDDWQQWQEAHATFYGDESGADTMRESLSLLFVTHTHTRSTSSLTTCVFTIR
jgi:hypothetical protein